MRDRFLPRQFAFGALDIYMDPLIVAGCVGEAVNLILGDLVPVADANLGANRGLEILKVVKDAHLSASTSVRPVA